MKIKTIFEFEEEFDNIRDLISPKTLFNVDDNLNAMQEIKRKLLHRIDYLVEKVCFLFSMHEKLWKSFISLHIVSNYTEFLGSLVVINWNLSN